MKLPTVAFACLVASLVLPPAARAETAAPAACPAFMLPAAAGTPVAAPAADGDKCASCSEQRQACKAFCGANDIIFSCQGQSPCGATCECAPAAAAAAPAPATAEGSSSHCGGLSFCERHGCQCNELCGACGVASFRCTALPRFVECVCNC